LFGRPDVVWGGFRKEVSPVGGFGSFDGLEVAEFGLSGNAVGVRGPELFRSPGGFSELLSESGQERGPPGLRPWGQGRVWGGGFDCRLECGDQDDLVYPPRREFDPNGERIYAEMHTGDWWWDGQVQRPNLLYSKVC